MFLITVLFEMTALAGFRAETSSANLGLLNVISCGSGLTCTKAGAKLNLSNNGYGYLRNQVATTTAALTSSQCGSTVISNSADVMTLPEASTVLGCRFTFVCGTADDFDVNPADGTDVIGVINSVAAGTGAAITPSAGDAIRCTDIGSSITLEATGANLWSAIGVGNGAWTDVN